MEKSSYLRSLYSDEEIPCLKKAKVYDGNTQWDKNIAGYQLRVPEICSSKLYNELRMFYFTPYTRIIKDTSNSNQLLLWESKVNLRYKAMYIGATMKDMINHGFTPQKAWENYIEMTKIGGYIYIPNSDMAFNTCIKTSCGISNRFDIFLFELKNHFENKEDFVYNDELKLSFFMPDNQKYFELFDDFKDFCDTFRLVGSFVDENYAIKWLVDPDCENNDENYKIYITNLIKVIRERSIEFLGSRTMTKNLFKKENNFKRFSIT